MIDTFRIDKGSLTVAVPLGETTRLFFNWPDANENVKLRLEFVEGYLRVFDENREDKQVEVYLVPGTDAYALEFYRNRIYICSQRDGGGPVLGRLFGPWPD